MTSISLQMGVNQMETSMLKIYHGREKNSKIIACIDFGLHTTHEGRNSNSKGQHTLCLKSRKIKLRAVSMECMGKTQHYKCLLCVRTIRCTVGQMKWSKGYK